MRITAVFFALLFFHSVLADECSMIITERVGSQNSIPSDCEKFVYYFQNPSSVSYWSVQFTWITRNQDKLTIYDGLDQFAPVAFWQTEGIVTGWRSTGRFAVIEFTRSDISDAPWSEWVLNFTNYEENPSAMTSLGFTENTKEDHELAYNQNITGVADDYLGSTWIIYPVNEYGYYYSSCTLQYYVAQWEDTTGTLEIFIQVGDQTIFLGPQDLRTYGEIYFYPSLEHGATLKVRSAVRTQPDSHSSFQITFSEVGYWGFSSSYSSSSSSGPWRPPIRIIALGVILGVVFAIAIALIVRCCYRRRKNRNVGAYQPLNTVTPTGLPTYQQPVVMMMPPNHQYVSVPLDSQTH